MAYKKKKVLPDELVDDHFTKSEIDVLCQLLFTYASKLSIDGTIHHKQIRAFNRQGLFELGIHSKEEWISKLLKHHPYNTIAENIIIAAGYLKARL